MFRCCVGLRDFEYANAESALKCEVPLNSQYPSNIYMLISN